MRNCWETNEKIAISAGEDEKTTVKTGGLTMLSIFHTNEFFNLHDGSHYLQSGDTVLPVWIEDDIAYSPLRGTFGGFGGAVSLKDYEHLVDQLLLLGCKEYRIKLAPSSHDQEAFALAFNVLSRAGFQVIGQELNYDQKIGDEIELSESNAKRLRKIKRLGFDAFPASLEEAYPMITENRRRKGRPVSMSLDALVEMAIVFPGHINCYSVMNDSYICAAAICIDISNNIRYVFMWGDAPGMESYSPIIMLADYIYFRAAMDCKTLLDVGTSTEDGMPNHGLVNFKRGLGFRESLKLTMGLKC